MGLLEKVNAQRGVKGFVEPPIWETDQLRFPFLSSYTAENERIENDFEGYVGAAYKANGVIFGCVDRRQQVFSQGRFQWQQYRNGKPGDFFGGPELSLLERPWPNGTTGELLAHMENDASLAGNFYCTVVDDAGRTGRRATGPGRRLARMRPDWNTLVIDAPSGNPFGVDARVVGHLYEPRLSGTPGASTEPLLLLPDEVCHYSPKPDPVARFRGMSWLTPILREIMADKSATVHKQRFFDNGATPNLAVKFDKDVHPDRFKLFVDAFNADHRGADNAYRTLFLGGGADVVPLSVDFRQLDFKATQGAGENRMAVAAGVPAAILGISEGLQGSTLNAGNFAAARRLFVDTTITDLWAKAAPSLQVLLTPPNPAANLAVDGRFIPFLREDEKDRAEIQAEEATTIRTLLDAGFEPGSVIAAIAAHDWRLLVHSGLFSVQLQAPGAMNAGTMGTLGAMNGSTRGLQTTP